MEETFKKGNQNFLPVLPLKNLVALPKSIIPVVVGRDISIKAIRDKMLIHTPPEHFLFLGYPNDHDIEMIFILRQEGKHEQFGNSRWVSFSVRRIARDIEEFLIWYNSYALKAIRDSGVNKKNC